MSKQAKAGMDDAMRHLECEAEERDYSHVYSLQELADASVHIRDYALSYIETIWFEKVMVKLNGDKRLLEY